MNFTRLLKQMGDTQHPRKAHAPLPTRLRVGREEVDEETPIPSWAPYFKAFLRGAKTDSKSWYEVIEELRCLHAAHYGYDIPKRRLSTLLKVAVDLYRWKDKDFDKLNELIQAIVDEINSNARFYPKFRIALEDYVREKVKVKEELEELAKLLAPLTTGMTDENLIAIRKLNVLSSEYRIHLESIALEFVRGLSENDQKKYLISREYDDYHWNYLNLLPILNLTALKQDKDSLPERIKLVLNKLEAINQFEEKLNAKDENGKLSPAANRLSAAHQYYLEGDFQPLIASHRDSPGKRFLKGCLFIFKTCGIGALFSSAVWQRQCGSISFGKSFLNKTDTLFASVPILNLEGNKSERNEKSEKLQRG